MGCWGGVGGGVDCVEGVRVGGEVGVGCGGGAGGVGGGSGGGVVGDEGGGGGWLGSVRWGWWISVRWGWWMVVLCVGLCSSLGHCIVSLIVDLVEIVEGLHLAG